MVYIALINPKNPLNVGSVLRAVGCFSADGVMYTGSRYDYASQYSTDTKNIAQNVPLLKVEDIHQTKLLMPTQTKVVAVELVVGATSLIDFEHPEHALYVLGPEDSSLPKDVVRLADEVVFIPTVGCMNLAATVNVLLYDRLVKRGLPADGLRGDELIKASRDNKNRLKM